MSEFCLRSTSQASEIRYGLSHHELSAALNRLRTCATGTASEGEEVRAGEHFLLP